VDSKGLGGGGGEPVLTSFCVISGALPECTEEQPKGFMSV
jgi:hypothetical protein